MIKLGVSEFLVLARIAFPEDGDLVLIAVFQVAVDGIEDNVAFGPHKPFVKRRLGIIQHLFPGLGPDQFFGGRLPIAQIILGGLFVFDLRIFDVGLL